MWDTVITTHFTFTNKGQDSYIILLRHQIRKFFAKYLHLHKSAFPSVYFENVTFLQFKDNRNDRIEHNSRSKQIFLLQ